jgi:hypothetical protein
VYRGKLESSYVRGTNAKLLEVAKDTLHKGEERSWGEIFTYATERSPYGSQYAMTKLGDDADDLDYLLRKVQRLYSYGELEFAMQYDEESDSTE